MRKGKSNRVDLKMRHMQHLNETAAKYQGISRYQNGYESIQTSRNDITNFAQPERNDELKSMSDEMSRSKTFIESNNIILQNKPNEGTIDSNFTHKGKI